MKFLKNWVMPFIVALTIVMGLETFVFTNPIVKADVLTEYKVNDLLYASKLDKTYAVGDIVMFKDNGTSLIRKITKIDSNVITVSDKFNNSQTINESEITGKIKFKVF